MIEPIMVAEIAAWREAERAATQVKWDTDDPCDSSCGSPCTPEGCHECHPAGEVLLIGPPYQFESLRFDRAEDAKIAALARNQFARLLDAAEENMRLREENAGYAAGFDTQHEEIERRTAENARLSAALAKHAEVDCHICNDTGYLDDAEAWDCGGQPSECPYCPEKAEAALAEVERLNAELQKWQPLTPEEAQKAYEEAEAVPLSKEEIDRILKRATDPAERLSNSEQAQLAAEIERLHDWETPCPPCRGDEGRETGSVAGWVASPCRCHPALIECRKIDVELQVAEAEVERLKALDQAYREKLTRHGFPTGPAEEVDLDATLIGPLAKIAEQKEEIERLRKDRDELRKRLTRYAGFDHSTRTERYAIPGSNEVCCCEDCERLPMPKEPAR